MELSEIRMPKSQRIGAHAKKLYELEDKLQALIREVVIERVKYLDRYDGEFFRIGLPQVLFDLMENYEDASVEAACLATLQRLGYHLNT